MSDQPIAPAAAADSQRTVLSRELASFLIEFSIGLNKFSMYPAGHPALGPTMGRLHQRLGRLLEGRRVLSVGVAQKQLVIEGVATDSKNPVLSSLAERLHDHNLGAVEFERGLESHELHTLVQLLLTDPEQEGGPFIQDLSKKLKPSRHLTLFPVRYEGLELLDDAEPEEEDDSGLRTRAAQLWVGLAQAAMGVEQDGDEEEEEHDPLLNDPGTVADAIRDHPESSAYDQVIVGYMLNIAEELRGAETKDAEVLKRRMGALVDGLDEGTLGRLLTMGGDQAQRRQFLQNAASGMEVDAVIDLVTAANDAQGENISRSLLRMLKKLAQQAGGAAPKQRALAETSVREHIGELIEGWSLNDWAPDEYAAAMEKMTSATAFVPVSPESAYRAEADRILQMALEIDEWGDAVIGAVDNLLEAGQAAWLLRGLGSAEAPHVVKAVREHLGQPHKVMQLIDAETVDVEAVGLLVEQIGHAAVPPMIELLKETEDQYKRRVIVDQLASLGPDVGPDLVAELADPRWQVKRNMLHVLGRLERLPDGFDPAEYSTYPKPPVRAEAVKMLLKDPTRRDPVLRQALRDPDEHLIRVGLRAAIEASPENAAPFIASKLRAQYPEDLRLMAVRALGKCGGHVAVKALLSIAAPRRRLFWWRTPHKTREYVAALHALRDHEEDNIRVTHALDVAARSRDAEIATAAGRRG